MTQVLEAEARLEKRRGLNKVLPQLVTYGVNDMLSHAAYLAAISSANKAGSEANTMGNELAKLDTQRRLEAAQNDPKAVERERTLAELRGQLAVRTAENNVIGTEVQIHQSKAAKHTQTLAANRAARLLEHYETDPHKTLQQAGPAIEDLKAEITAQELQDRKRSKKPDSHIHGLSTGRKLG